MDVLQASHLNKQRHRGLAPWPKSPSVWTNTTSAVPSYPASSQGSEVDSNSDPPGVRKEAATNSATKVQRAAAENLRAVTIWWNEVAWNEVVMERSDRNSIPHQSGFIGSFDPQ